MNILTIILIIIMVILAGIGIVAYGWIIKSWWVERKAKKEFEKRQERYRKMI